MKIQPNLRIKKSLKNQEINSKIIWVSPPSNGVTLVRAAPTAPPYDATVPGCNLGISDRSY
jgi:hypothetical protein